MSERGLTVPAGLEPLVRQAAERGHISAGEWLRRAITRALAQDRAPVDALTRLSRLEAPTGDIQQMLAEIELGRS